MINTLFLTLSQSKLPLLLSLLALANVYIHARVHNPKRANSMRSCYGVFTDQFIFRTVLARILNTF